MGRLYFKRPPTSVGGIPSGDRPLITDFLYTQVPVRHLDKFRFTIRNAPAAPRVCAPLQYSGNRIFNSRFYGQFVAAPPADAL